MSTLKYCLSKMEKLVTFHLKSMILKFCTHSRILNKNITEFCKNIYEI